MSARRRLLAALSMCALGACAGPRAAATPSDAPAPTTVTAPAPAPAPPAPRWTRTDPPGSLPDVPRTAPHREVRIMPNGLRVIVEQHRSRPLVSIRLIFSSGAAADPAATAGFTYFAVHTLTGTYDQKGEDGGPADLEEKSARRLVADLGGALMADVGADHALIGIDGFSRDTDLYLSRLLDVVREPRCGEWTFAALADAVTDRLNELEVSDSAVLEEHMGRIAFGEGSGYARPIYGTPSSLSQLGLEDVSDRQEQLLTPVGSTLVVAGDVEPAAVFRAAQRTLGAWYPRRGPASPRPSLGAPPGRRQHVTLLPRPHARTTLVCAARRFAQRSAPDAAVTVLAHVLGKRLDRELRDARGLTYGARAVPLRHPGARAILACTRLDADHTQDGMKAFVEGVASLAKSPPSEAEVGEARSFLVAEWEMSRDTLDGAVRLYERSLGQDDDIDPSARIAALQTLSVSEVQALARSVGDVARLQIVTSGESRRVESAVRELRLGKIHVPAVGRVETEDE